MPPICVVPRDYSIFESMETRPYYPMEITFKGKDGDAVLKCIRSIVEVSENVFQIVCGSEKIDILKNEFVLKI